MTDAILIDERRRDTAWLTMNRPAVRNALATELVQALRDGLRQAAQEDGVRAVVLAGAGPVFCAGADVNQYRDAFDRERVLEEGGRLYDLLDEIVTCSKPVIARVQRAAFGGAIGIVAAADLVVASEGTRFSLSEARLGLVPAVISPAVITALGSRTAKALMLLAEPFGTDEALRLGLIQRVVAEEGLDAAVGEWLAMIRANAPGALRDAKALVSGLTSNVLTPREQRDRVVTLAASRRADLEGQEGLSAFLEKRRPAWRPED
ncbi:MAG: enoyl-CoA hydratase-related protein [Vicinamibacterales bacterium]